MAATGAGVATSGAGLGLVPSAPRYNEVRVCQNGARVRMEGGVGAERLVGRGEHGGGAEWGQVGDRGGKGQTSRKQGA